MNHFKRFIANPFWAGFIFLIIIAFSSCSEEDIPKGLLQIVSQEVKAALGDTLTTPDDISLELPAGALYEDGMVFLGRTGDEPNEVPNTNFMIEGEPVTLKLPTGVLYKPLKLSIPHDFDISDVNTRSVILFNGTDYIPLEYYVTDNKLSITVDRLNLENEDDVVPGSVSEVVILFLVNKQKPSEEEQGLKHTSLTNKGEMVYAEPTATAESKVLLMVHGWLANSNRWVDFMQDLDAQEEQLYTDYWTFNYNSSWSIEKNAELLYDALETQANGAEIDIVAHSMGGLVARSMLETFGGDQYVSRLVTLGTPHLGSPLAVFRPVIGQLISLEGSEDYTLYNYYSKGFKDLNPDSEFIQSMKQLDIPPIPYYTLACKNKARTPYALTASEMLEGDDDGVVEVRSALGVPGAETTGQNVQIDVDFAHLEMPDNDFIFHQIISILSSN